MGGFGGPGAAAPDVPKLLATLAADPGVDVSLVRVEDCAGARCYRVRAAIPAGVVWSTLVEAMSLDQLAPDAARQPPDFPGLGLEAVFDTTSLRLAELSLAAHTGSSDVSAVARFTAHDRPLTVQAPPPGLVDQFGGFGP
jgi:hypothetical protein